MDGRYFTITDCEDRFFALKLDVNSERLEPGAIPRCCGDFVVPAFKVNRVQFMGHDTAPKFVSHRFGAACMIKVTVGKQKILKLPSWIQAFGNVFTQS